MKRDPIKSVGIALIGVIGLIYILNPTAGVIELIPDNFSIVGNLDEAAATALILSTLRFFGFDLTSIFSKDKISKD